MGKGKAGRASCLMVLPLRWPISVLTLGLARCLSCLHDISLITKLVILITTLVTALWA